jgi:hypothetical protein
LLRGVVRALNKEDSAFVVLIRPFINTVFMSEFLDVVSHASFSPIHPASTSYACSHILLEMALQVGL